MGIYALIFLPYAFIFKKADEARWKAFVPFYNAYMVGKVAKDQGCGWLYLGTLIIYAISSRASNELGAVMAIVFYIVQCFICVALASRFNQGAGLKILVCVPIIAWFALRYLALSKDCVYKEFNSAQNEQG